jgi:hypothetical protein
MIYTPQYKLKADKRTKGVGYESNIMSDEIYQKSNEEKFIPVLFEGSWDDVVPTWAGSKKGVDLSNNDPGEYKQLLDCLLGSKKNLQDPLSCFSKIILKYTSRYGLSEACMEEINDAQEISDIIDYLANNIASLNLWWSQGSCDNHIKNISRSDDGNYMFDYMEMDIKTLYVFRLHAHYGGSLIVVETNPLKPQANNCGGLDTEEVCFCNGKIITRQEYDAGWARIDGKMVELSERNSSCIVRTVRQTIYFLSPQEGAYCYSNNNELFEEIYDDYTKNKIPIKNCFAKLKLIKRDQSVKWLD